MYQQLTSMGKFGEHYNLANKPELAHFQHYQLEVVVNTNWSFHQPKKLFDLHKCNTNRIKTVFGCYCF